jgi:hypothetical protein
MLQLKIEHSSDMIVIFKYLKFRFKEEGLNLLHKAPEDKSKKNSLKIWICKFQLSARRTYQ